MDQHEPRETLPGAGPLVSSTPPQRHAAVRALLLAEASGTGAPVPGPRTREHARRRHPVRQRLAAAPAWVRWTGLAAAPALAAAGAAALWAGDARTSRPRPPAPARQELIAWSPVPAAVAVPPTPAPGSPTPPARAHVDLTQYWTTPCSDWIAGDLGFPDAAAMSARATHHVLAERRAGSVLCVDIAYGDGTAEQQTVAVGGVDPGRSVGGGDVGFYGWTRLVSPPTGDVVVLVGGDSTALPHRGDANTAMLFGAAGPEVTGVAVVLADGVTATASLRDGVWAVWWPLDRGAARGARLVVTTTQGQRTIDPEAVRLAPDAD